jgi:hypothetical protein
VGLNPVPHKAKHHLTAGFGFRENSHVMNPEAQRAFNTLRNLIASPDIKNSFDTLLHAFLNTDGHPRPQTATAKSSSALSRMLNRYALPALALLRASRAIIRQSFKPSSAIAGNAVQPSS